MTSAENNRLNELYRQLNQDHAPRREALLQQLPATVSENSDHNATEVKPRRRATRCWWLASGAAVVAMLTLGIFFVKPHDAWAEVVKAVRSQKWIHYIQKDNQGNIRVEAWESSAAEISASKMANEFRLADKGSSLLQVYYPAQKKVVRLELKDQEQPDTVQLFIQVLLGEAEQLRFLQVIDRQQRTVTEQGRTWDEIRLTIEPIGGTPMVWIATVDPKTHLPQTFRVEVPGAPGLPLPPAGEFDYPAEGPATLAALGVPEDAELEDRVPRDSLKNILAEMKTQRRKLGAYYLRIVAASEAGLRVEAWKDGLKWRQDYSQPEICDGRESWSKHMGPWKLLRTIPSDARADDFCRLNPHWYYLENLAYPFLSASPDFELTVRPDRKDGPSGCVLVERTASRDASPIFVHRFTPRREQYWLDPNRGHILVKRVLTDLAATEAEALAAGHSKHLETTYSDFRQSPSGVWYPTTVDTTGTLWIKRFQPTVEAEPLDQHWKLTVEFKKSLPDEIFDIKAARNR